MKALLLSSIRYLLNCFLQFCSSCSVFTVLFGIFETSSVCGCPLSDSGRPPFSRSLGGWHSEKFNLIVSISYEQHCSPNNDGFSENCLYIFFYKITCTCTIYIHCTLNYPPGNAFLITCNCHFYKTSYFFVHKSFHP